MSARNSQRPESRASTTSATSQRHESLPAHDGKSAYLNSGPEAVLLQYHANNMAPQSMSQYDSSQQQQQQPQQPHYGHQHSQSLQFNMQPQYSDQSFMQQDVPTYGPGHVRVGSMPVQGALDIHDDKRRKGSAVTATNDKELREMLAKNEGRPLPEVAQEVIQKERTPMAEKTKQLFAMLWYVFQSHPPTLLLI
jgi:regulatory factor X